jgi:aldehyde dehydrogenase (NAD+)
MQSVFDKLGIADDNPGVFDGEWSGSSRSGKIDKISPINGRRLASVRSASDDDYEKAISRAQEAFLKWRVTPAPVRGETVRRLGNALRELKHELGQLVTLETGKIIAEGEGEVQEMIDICDFAVGQSRMLYGLTIQSERPSHRLMVQFGRGTPRWPRFAVTLLFGSPRKKHRSRQLLSRRFASAFAAKPALTPRFLHC